MLNGGLLEIGRGRRSFSLLSLVLNVAVLLALLVWPLLHPLALPKQPMAMLLAAPAPPLASQPRPPAMPPAATRATPTMVLRAFEAPSRIVPLTQVAQQSAPLINLAGSWEGQAGQGPLATSGVLSSIGSAPAAAVVSGPKTKMPVSSGVMAGNRIAGADPVYPAIARASRTQGTVVLMATISRTGMIENLRVMSGPAMLAASAVEAAKNWRYRPYLLNGEPVEVETTINVVFNLGS